MRSPIVLGSNSISNHSRRLHQLELLPLLSWSWAGSRGQPRPDRCRARQALSLRGAVATVAVQEVERPTLHATLLEAMAARQGHTLAHKSMAADGPF
jgi:hypothetical protein